MSRWLSRVFPYLLLVPAVLPLVYFSGLLYPYLTPKTLLFRSDAILACAAFVALLLGGRSFYFSRLRNPRTWIPAALLALAYVSSFVGVDFYHSFWSIFDRGDGLLSLTAAIAFFYLIVLYADSAFISRLFNVIVFTASLAALIGVLQWLQAISGMNFPLVPPSSGRIGSTLGNAAFFASYLGMTLFLTLSVMPSLRGTWRSAALGAARLHILAIIITATRGSLLALIAASFAALLYIAWKGGDDSYRSYARVGIGLTMILSGLFFAFRTELASVPFAPVARLASISAADASVESRLFIWQHVLAEPVSLLGVGAENIEILFNRFYDPSAIIEQWFDRTHNAFLDYLVQYGILGLMLYLALIAAFAYEAYRLTRSAVPNEARRGRVFLLLALVYSVQNFFVFDTATTLWLFLALYATLLARDKEQVTAFSSTRLPSFVPIGAGVLIALLVIPVSWMPLCANLLLAEGYTYQIVNVPRAVESIKKGYELGTYADMEYGYQLYEIYTGRQINQLAGEAKILAYRLARDILAKNFERYSYDARTVIYYAHILDVAPKGEEPDEELLRKVVGRAIELSPKRMQSRYLLANISIRKGDNAKTSAEKKAYYDEAIRELNTFGDLVPHLAEPRYVIATLYLTLGENVVAGEWADEGRAIYKKSDENTARRAARYYVTVGDWENARYFLQEVVNADSTDYPFLYDLAKAEFLSGNVERAQEIVAELQQKSPGLAEGDPAFLQALGE